LIVCSALRPTAPRLTIPNPTNAAPVRSLSSSSGTCHPRAPKRLDMAAKVRHGGGKGHHVADAITLLDRAVWLTLLSCIPGASVRLRGGSGERVRVLFSLRTVLAFPRGVTNGWRTAIGSRRSVAIGVSPLLASSF
jgi:hypothetical protein